MNRLKSMSSDLRKGNQKVFGVMILSAVYVTVIRLLGPLNVGWDQSIQLEAAYRLIQGLGLTNAFSPQANLNQSPISEYLTHHPPIFSLLAAAFLAAGISLPAVLKLIYSLTTIIGWAAWSLVSSRCLVEPIACSGRLFPVNLVIAVALPIFYTPSWSGTDIFLWAGIPAIALLLLPQDGEALLSHPKPRGPSAKARTRIQFSGTILSGLVLGLLVSVRYFSIFLLLAALFMTIYAYGPKISVSLKRSLAIYLSSFLILIPTFLYLRWASALTKASISSSNNLLQTHKASHHRAADSDFSLLASAPEAIERVFSSF